MKSQAEREKQYYETACVEGRFFLDKSYDWSAENWRDIVCGYYIVFISWDGQRVITHRKRKPAAQKICDHLNSLGSVKKVDAYREKARQQT